MKENGYNNKTKMDMIAVHRDAMDVDLIVTL